MFRYAPPSASRRSGPMRRSSTRRVVLVVDGLESRYAPAGINVLGSSAIGVELTAPAVVEIAPAPRSEVVVSIASARIDDVSIGFLHPFAQNGFSCSESDVRKTQAPQPAPIQPPAQPVTVLPQPAQESPEPINEAPPIQPAVLSAPRQLPMKLDVVPAAVDESRPVTMPVEQAQSEPATVSGSNFEADEVPTADRSGLAMMSGMMAAGLFYVQIGRDDEAAMQRLLAIR